MRKLFVVSALVSCILSSNALACQTFTCPTGTYTVNYVTNNYNYITNNYYGNVYENSVVYDYDYEYNDYDYEYNEYNYDYDCDYYDYGYDCYDYDCDYVDYVDYSVGAYEEAADDYDDCFYQYYECGYGYDASLNGSAYAVSAYEEAYNYESEYYEDYSYGYSEGCSGTIMCHWANLRDAEGNVIGCVQGGSSVQIIGQCDDNPSRTLIYDEATGCYGTVASVYLYGGTDYEYENPTEWSGCYQESTAVVYSEDDTWAADNRTWIEEDCNGYQEAYCDYQNANYEDDYNCDYVEECNCNYQYEYDYEECDYSNYEYSDYSNCGYTYSYNCYLDDGYYDCDEDDDIYYCTSACGDYWYDDDDCDYEEDDDDCGMTWGECTTITNNYWIDVDMSENTVNFVNNGTIVFVGSCKDIKNLSDLNCGVYSCDDVKLKKKFCGQIEDYTCDDWCVRVHE